MISRPQPSALMHHTWSRDDRAWRGTGPADPLTSGEGDLACALVDGASSARSARAASPLKLLVPRPRGPAVWAYAATFGGGLLAGDHLRLRLAVEAGATLLLGTQASTKIYRSERAEVARQEVDATVAADAALVLLPDPVVAFAGARYDQQQRIGLDAGGSLLLLDWLTSGRTARAERWAFTSYASRTTVRVADRPVAIEALGLEGDAMAAQAGRFHCLATALLIGPRCAPAARDLLAAVGAVAVPRRGDLLESASPLADGAILRIAGTTHEAVEHRLRARLGPAAATLLGDDPWSRKP